MLYAGFWKRLCAYFLDGIVTYILFVVFGLLIIVIRKLFGWWPITAAPVALEELPPIRLYLQIFVGFLPFIIFKWLYYAIMEASRLRSTFGKKIMGLVVVDERLGRVSFWRASGRYWARFLSILTVSIGYMMAGFTAKKQALHDLVTGTLVLNQSVLEFGQGGPAPHPDSAWFQAYEELVRARSS